MVVHVSIKLVERIGFDGFSYVHPRILVKDLAKNFICFVLKNSLEDYGNSVIGRFDEDVLLVTILDCEQSVVSIGSNLTASNFCFDRCRLLLA